MKYSIYYRHIFRGEMKKVFLMIFMLIPVALRAQQPFPVTDKDPATYAGLTMGYTIKSTEVKAVSDKGDFSRYSIKFFVTNNTPEAKIILYKQGWNVLGNVSDQLVQFNCLNATGARLTSKGVTLRAAECNVLAVTEDKDCATGKTTQNKRLVQIGYWIQAGQTITTDAIMICPLNELPRMEAVYMANSLQPSASASIGTPAGGYNNANNNNAYNNAPVRLGGQGFVKIRNVQTNTYLNFETGTMRSSTIDPGWWSAQWTLTQIPGARLYTIKNKWKESYLSIDRGGLSLFVNYMSDGARWMFEPAETYGTFRIKNLDNNQYLYNSGSELKFSPNGNFQGAVWALEGGQ